MPIEHWSERIWLVTLADEPSLSEDLSHLRTAAATEATMPDLVLDLSGVTRVNSSHLSQLLRLRKLVIDRDARLRLAAPSNAVWGLFLTTGLDKVFTFSQDISTALASLQLSR